MCVFSWVSAAVLGGPDVLLDWDHLLPGTSGPLPSVPPCPLQKVHLPFLKWSLRRLRKPRQGGT